MSTEDEVASGCFNLFVLILLLILIIKWCLIGVWYVRSEHPNYWHTGEQVVEFFTPIGYETYLKEKSDNTLGK